LFPYLVKIFPYFSICSRYLFTYYKKSREERAEDYRKIIPKLSVFVPDDQTRIREQVEEAINTLKKEDLASVLEFINGKMPARE